MVRQPAARGSDFSIMCNKEEMTWVCFFRFTFLEIIGLGEPELSQGEILQRGGPQDGSGSSPYLVLYQ